MRGTTRRGSCITFDEIGGESTGQPSGSFFPTQVRTSRHRPTMAGDSRSWLRRLTLLSLLTAPIHSLRSFILSSPLLPSKHTSNNVPTLCAPSGVIECPNRPQIQMRRLPLFSVSVPNDVEEDADFEEFFNELLEQSSVASNTTDNSGEEGGENVPSHFIEGKSAVGIGGNDGFVYDVNALKRNLVQESVRGCKQELLVLLGDGRQLASSKSNDDNQQPSVTPRWRRDRDDLIEDRLSSLVQANPVSTTTDSNLLDGEWSFAFATNSASVILDTSRFLLSKTKRIDHRSDKINAGSDNESKAVAIRGSPWRFRGGKTENPFRSSTRQIFLENLRGDENAHIVDETSVLGGLFQIGRRYDVFGLTRTALDLDLTQSESKLCGFLVNGKDMDDFKGTELGNPLEIQILYLDSDLCICTTGAGLDGPLHVYTKSDLWVTGSAKRKVSDTIKWKQKIDLHAYSIVKKSSGLGLSTIAAVVGQNCIMDINNAVTTSNSEKTAQLVCAEKSCEIYDNGHEV
ncbi:hypothetical protein ACHAWF_012398 [Thalassiosira exigua]